jgi:hypothetical protein
MQSAVINRLNACTITLGSKQTIMDTGQEVHHE